MPSRLPLAARLPVAIIASLAAGFGIWNAFQLARAEQLADEDTVPALTEAARHEPADAAYYVRIATLDASRESDLRTALALNPRDPSSWIAESVRQEETGDVAGAEKSLLQANAVCRYYVPRWSLAAFYYRQRNQAGFMRWAKAALSSGYGDPTSLFQMAQRLQIPASTILGEMLPTESDRVASYLQLVQKQGNLDAEYDAAMQLMRLGTKEQRPSILETCDSLFLADRTQQAITLWNRAIELKWVNGSPLDPSLGKSIGDDSLADEPLEGGFEWRRSIPSGVSAAQSAPERSLNLEFSGKQPEAADLGSELVPLLPNQRYRVDIRYRLSLTNSTESGLQLSLLPLPGGKAIMASLLSQKSDDFVEQPFLFQTPPKLGPAKLLLSYNRQPGTTRMEGRVWIQWVRLTLLP